MVTEKNKAQGGKKEPVKQKVMPDNTAEVDTSKVKTEPKEKQKGAAKGKLPQKKKVMPKGDTSTDVKPKEAVNPKKYRKMMTHHIPKVTFSQKMTLIKKKAISDWFEQRNLKNWQGFMKEIDKEQAGALLGLIRGSIKQTERMKEEEKKRNEELK